MDDCSTRDSDGDGVNDCLDKCPGTLTGAKVDDTGCLIKIELRGVNFEYDSAELTPKAKSILDGVADQLVAFPDEKKDIEVQGHASSEGSSKYNMALSEPHTVGGRLPQERGVTNNLYAKGYGEDIRSRTTAPRKAARRTGVSSDLDG